MILDERQFEQMARWLDGEEVHLTDEQREALSDLRRDEAHFSEMLDVSVPAGAMDRAKQRMRAELAHPHRRTIRVAAWVGGALAAAAAIVLAAGMWLGRGGPDTPQRETLAALDLVEAIYAIEASPADTDLAAEEIDEEIDEFDQEMLASIGDVPAPLSDPLGENDL